VLCELLTETEAFVEQVQEQFERSNTWDMAVLEGGLREALLKDGCRILEGLLNQPHALGKHTPEGSCHENRSKRVQSLLGSFNLMRGYYKTAQGRCFPMDEVLGLTDSYTPGLAKMMCRAAGTDGSYDEAQETLSVYAGVTVPASQIRRMVQRIGPEIAQWSAEREEPRREAAPTLYVSYDGTGVPMRKSETQGRRGKQPDGSAATREVKLGSVFTSEEVDDEGNPIRDPGSTTYVASFENAEAFGAMIRQEARLRGVGQAKRVAVIGDGARWIWHLARINFPQAEQILDFYHACEHLSKLANALFPNSEERVGKLVRKWTKWLEKDKVLRVVEEARKHLPHHGPRRDTAITEIGYFEINADRMMYASFREQGYFIGSGVVEAGCKTVVGKRTKQSGMFWRIAGAQNILDIRCSVISDTYDRYWQARRDAQIQALDLAA
jgi:hypothetical protein